MTFFTSLNIRATRCFELLIISVPVAILSQTLVAQSLPNFADLVEENASSIVEITTTKRAKTRSSLPDGEIEELLRRLNPGEDPSEILENAPQQRQR
ncbi:MAG TPA: hypothetical protein DCL66_14230, partial [Gammaproteobacteria bacterium]|nr:hypothetical protein [Gammaproteobacteria bacterium]